MLCDTVCTSFDLEFSLTIRQQCYTRDIYSEIQQESLRDKIAVEGIFLFLNCLHLVVIFYKPIFPAACSRTVTRSTCVCKLLASVAISFRSCVLISVCHVYIHFLHILTFPCLLFCFIVYVLEILEGAFLWTGSIYVLCAYTTLYFNTFFQVGVSDGMVLLRPVNKSVATVLQDYVMSL